MMNIYLTDRNFFRSTSIFTKKFTEDGYEICREYKIKDYFC